MRIFITVLALSVTFFTQPAECKAQTLTPRLHRDSKTPDTFLNGNALGLSITGVARGDTVTIRTYRRFLQQRTLNNATVTDTVLFASWAQFRANAQGRISVDNDKPIDGTWRDADPLGPFWSMHSLAAENASGIPVRTPARGSTEVVLVQRGRVLDSLTVRNVLPKLQEQTVVNESVVGAYAAPDDGASHPALILLHGSEGGDTTSAKTLARRFAARGFAAFAVVYVAYPYVGKFSAVPSAFVNIPVETLDRARNWMGSQANADTSRTGIWGVSKGAEFALVAASRRTWPSAVVACVASDVVWSGFGRAAAPGELLSSWSDGGKSLNAIPYDNYDDVFAKKATAREVHDRSRAKFPAEATNARIDVGAIKSPALIYGSGADEVWASASMVKNIEGAMKQSSNANLLTARTFERSGHGICGDGTTPAEFLPSGPVPDPNASAMANSATWRETIQFLRTNLKTR